METSEKASYRKDRYGIIKFIFSVMIVCLHYNNLIGKPYAISSFKVLNFYWYLCQQFGGKLPVCFFFLSGYFIDKGYFFLISKKEIPFIQFLKKRIFRLYPLMIISIFIWTFGQFVYLHKYGVWWTNRPADVVNIFFALTGISVGTFVNGIDTVNGPIWYISVLIVCYIIYFITTSRVTVDNINQSSRYAIGMYSDTHIYGGGYYLILVVLGLAIITYQWNFPFATNSMGIGYMSFFTGILFNKLFSKYQRKFKYISFIGTFVFLTLIFLYKYDFMIILGNTSLFLCFIFMPILISCIESFKFLAFMDNPIFRFLGELSFPIYLCHMPILVCTVTFKGNDFSIFVILVFIVSSILLFIDKPIQKYLKNKYL